MDFNYVDVSLSSKSWKFEQDKPTYCFIFNRQHLQNALTQAQRNFELPESSWK